MNAAFVNGVDMPFEVVCPSDDGMAVVALDLWVCGVCTLVSDQISVGAESDGRPLAGAFSIVAEILLVVTTLVCPRHPLVSMQPVICSHATTGIPLHGTKLALTSTHFWIYTADGTPYTLLVEAWDSSIFSECEGGRIAQVARKPRIRAGEKLSRLPNGAAETLITRKSVALVDWPFLDRVAGERRVVVVVVAVADPPPFFPRGIFPGKGPTAINSLGHPPSLSFSAFVPRQYFWVSVVQKHHQPTRRPQFALCN